MAKKISKITEEVVEAPKKKRGRPSKAELEARRIAEAAAAAAAEMKNISEEDRNTEAEIQTTENIQAQQLTLFNEDDTQTVADEPQTIVESEESNDGVSIAETRAIVENSPIDSASENTEVEESTAEVPVKRRRRSREEIMEAAARAAEALAAKKSEMEGVPEAAFATETYTDDENEEVSQSLLEKLQDKVKKASDSAETVWEDDPADGTDFIIVNDIPVEDNAAIPYTDIFDTPQNVVNIPVAQQQTTNETIPAYDFEGIIKTCGLLEIMPDGYGFLRSSDYNYLSSPDDVYLTVQQIRQFSLKTGDIVECTVRPAQGNERYFTLSKVTKVNGRDPREIRDRISFENLTPLFPEEKFNLCGDRRTTNTSTRIVDLFSPIGKGQRSLIVAQPKTGKTILMKDIANAIAANHPEAYIMMLLIDERPEEVTDMSRTVNAEVIASTFDEPADRHVKIAGLVLEKAKRLVECGHDVVIFLDSITRLARAYNTVAPASGKVLTGGVDASALQKPKRFFGAARNIENGGSLTIIATALTDTGSKMDEVIFEEFKGTGNSELQLDRQLANKRIFPAVNLVLSSTRRDDLLQDDVTVNRMWILRKHIADMNASEAMNEVHGLMQRTRTNEEFLMAMNG